MLKKFKFKEGEVYVMRGREREREKKYVLKRIGYRKSISDNLKKLNGTERFL